MEVKTRTRMADEESEKQQEFRLPRIKVRMPEPPTWKLTSDDLKRYERSRLIVGNDDPDVKFRKSVDAKHEAEVKQAHVDALIGMFLDKPNAPSLVPVMFDKGISVFEQHKALLKAGVLQTEIAHATEKLPRVFNVGEKGTSGYLLRTGDGEERPASTLRISSWYDKGKEKESSVTFNLTQKQGPWSGKIEINIPINQVEGDKEIGVPDSTSSRIISASGTLEKVNFEDAVKLMIDTANSAAEDFEEVVQEVDEVFRDAEMRHKLA